MKTLEQITPLYGQPLDPPPLGAQPTANLDVNEAANEQLRHDAADLKESGTEALQSAKEAGTQFVDAQKEKVAARLDHYTEAVKAACETLQATEGNPLVSPGQRASRQMERAAEYLRSHDATDFFNDLGNLARRRPEIVFGGLFVLGLASTRFLKASSQDPRSSPTTGGTRGNSRRIRPYQPVSDSATRPSHATTLPPS